MNNYNKDESPLSKYAASLLKANQTIGKDKFDALTKEEQEQVLSNITDKEHINEYIAFTDKLDKQHVWKDIKGNKRSDFKIKYLYKYAVAASAAIIISLFFLKENNFQNNEPTVVDSKIEIGSDKATLTLDNGSDIILEKGTSYQTSNVNSDGEKIIYNAGENPSEEIAYNYLTIPRGGQFQIQLSDGTKVWLNSESQLKYPVAFVKGETRQVELVYGEAYFDVSPSTEHNGDKFKVSNNNQEVEVLGTEFNIKAYKDETNIYTTLVEGSVAVNTNSENKKLIPGEQSNLNLQNNTVSITTVDVYNEVAWKEGVFSFRGKRLEDLMKTLARWYDMDVVFENENSKEIKFKGVLRKQQSIEEVMSIIKSTSVNNYTIDNKTISIE